jgi:hypothetical protein
MTENLRATMVRLVIAAGVVGAFASPSYADDQSGGAENHHGGGHECHLQDLRGTYTFTATGSMNSPTSPLQTSGSPNLVSPIALAGFFVFDGKGNVTLQATDNDGGGSGAVFPQVNTITGGAVNQVGSSGCLFRIYNLAYKAGINLTMNVFSDRDGKSFTFIVTNGPVGSSGDISTPGPQQQPGLVVPISLTGRAEGRFPRDTSYKP